MAAALTLVVAAPCLADSPPADTLRTPDSYVRPHRFWRASLNLALVHGVVWSYDRFIREGGSDPEFRVGWNSLVENLRNGMEWDDNAFPTNHFGHPFHGALYFQGARAVGYSFWQSAPWAFAGSYIWENFGEINHAAINDWINTGMGGMAFGESLHRLSDMILDNTARGAERGWRELGGFLVNPPRGFTRLVTGAAFDVHANDPDRFPDYAKIDFRFGMRAIEDDASLSGEDFKPYLRFVALHGDPFREPMKRPFDYFDFEIQINFDDGNKLGRIKATGLLVSTHLNQTDGSDHIIGASQHFDYIDNDAFEFGNQSISGTYLGQFFRNRSFEVHTTAHLNAILLGATKSDYFSVSGRDYDYGSGAGYEVAISLNRNGYDLLAIERDEYYIHVLNGNNADHFVNFTRVRLEIPLMGFLAVGANYYHYVADRNYDDYPDVVAQAAEYHVYLAWIAD